MLELALVFCTIETTLRFGNKSIGTKLPELVTADLDPISRPAWTCVGSRKRPMKLGPIIRRDYVVVDHKQVRKIVHEAAGDFCNRRTTHSRRAIVHLKDTAF